MELRRPGRLAIGDLLRGLQRTLVLELGGHANRAESVIADPSLDAGVGRASHHPHIQDDRGIFDSAFFRRRLSRWER
jgi:hypothetical protein